MLVKSQVKYIQSLGHKKFRDADGVFIAEGPKIVLELLQAGNINLIECFATEDWLTENSILLKGRKSSIVPVNLNELERISFHNTPNQVLAVFSKPTFNRDTKQERLTLLLDTIQDPGNLGTIVRTADWFGVKVVVCSNDSADVFNPKVVQSAMGSIARVELIYTNLIEYIKSKPDIPVFGISLGGEDLTGRIQLSKGMFLIGNESKGIRPELEAMAVKRFRIPGAGGAESLNVAVATGIILSQIELIS
jgi:RNA methyltransferase, TrmH family